jgi:hypothetical protein
MDLISPKTFLPAARLTIGQVRHGGTFGHKSTEKKIFYYQ